MKEIGLEGLRVWQKARELTVMVCGEVLPMFPNNERFAMEQQLRRSVQSVPANIAEAFGRFSFQETLRFSYIARGSLEETYSHMMIARDLGYIREDVFESCADLYQETARLLNGYISYVKRTKHERIWNGIQKDDGP